MSEYIIYSIIVFLYGITIGSFLNVCILRIPLKESIVTGRSHCDECGYQLRWYDLIPILSYLFLWGRCRKCKTKISIQYPLIEALNGILYVLVFCFQGWNYLSAIYCLAISALIVLSVIDFRTNMIPVGINIYLLAVGILRVGLDYRNMLNYLIGFISVSGFLFLIYIVTKGNGIGGGDIKLMAPAGLLLGWKLVLLAFFLGCIYGAVIHPIRMKLAHQGRVLAFGPYLSAGIITAILFGDRLLSWYLTLFYT